MRFRKLPQVYILILILIKVSVLRVRDMQIPPAPTVGLVNIESLREDLVRESSDRETAEPSVTDGNRKKRSASIEAHTGAESDEPPKKKKKKEKKKRKKHVEERSEPSGDVGGRELVAHDSSNRDVAAQTNVELDDSPNVPLERRKKTSHGQDAPASIEKTPLVAPSTTKSSGSASKGDRIKFPDHVEFKYDGDTLLAYAPKECAELVQQIRGGAKDMPPAKDLVFKDAYVDAARTKILSDGSMKYVVEMYDTALKETISKLKQAEKLVRVKDTALNRKTNEFKATIDKAAAEQSRLLEEKKAQKEKFAEKFGELKGKFKTTEWGDVSGVDRTEDASEPTTAPAVPDPGPAALNLTVREESSGPTLGVGDEDPTLPLVELSDSSAEEDGGDESNELVRASNPLGTEEDLGESSAKEQGNVDKVENPPDSTADRTEDASDPLGAQVTGEDLDHAEE
ncbi:hypothetical protein DY000_02039450 [Brassica cretica]|uniref:Uncharacterized protein n=1 Tax=Brassica cretica TaxID=69181 RepID=A0ABQ7B670_BRACR|nr:hypothetical protein DY000_02039450 [Brassica cretica]